MATVTIREKRLKDGRVSLYLDIYSEGVRRYETLRLYIEPERNETVKAQNRANRKLAEVVRGKRLVELQNSAHGFVTRYEKALLLPTFDKFSAGRNTSTYDAVRAHLAELCNKQMKVAQMDRRWAERYVAYLRERGAKESSIKQYITMFRAFVRWCIKRGVISANPFEGVKIHAEQAKIEYLTIEELRALIAVPTKYGVRDMFLFSCFTGLRYSDVSELRWGDVEETNGSTRLRYRQKKTRKFEYVDINAQAVALMGARRADEERVFATISTHTRNYQLRRWVKSAGIRKHITFHCARHTFATMLITQGVDIYTVSKLLGHSSVATTQIYAEVVDKKKRDAVETLPKLL